MADILYIWTPFGFSYKKATKLSLIAWLLLGTVERLL